MPKCIPSDFRVFFFLYHRSTFTSFTENIQTYFIGFTQFSLRVQHRGMMMIIKRLIKPDNVFRMRVCTVCVCLCVKIATYRKRWMEEYDAVTDTQTYFCNTADNDGKTNDAGNNNHATMTTTN